MAKLLNKSASNVARPNFNPADGFLNIDLIKANGSIKKVGAIPLHEEKELHALLLKYADRIVDMRFSMNIHVIEKEDNLEDELFAPVSDEELAKAVKAS